MIKYKVKKYQFEWKSKSTDTKSGMIQILRFSDKDSTAVSY